MRQVLRDRHQQRRALHLPHVHYGARVVRAPLLLHAKAAAEDTHVAIVGGEEEGVGAAGYGGDPVGAEEGGRRSVAGGDLGDFEEIEGFPLRGAG